MFEILYKDPATIERYRLAPLLEDRERYLCAVVASGVVGDVARRVLFRRLFRERLIGLFRRVGAGISHTVPVLPDGSVGHGEAMA